MSKETTPSGYSFDRRILEVLRGLVEHHSSSRGVAEEMGQAHNYVARILRGETKLRLDVLGRILEAVGISESFFLKLVVADGGPDNAVEILRFYGADGPPPSAFVEELAPRVEEWLADREGSGGTSPSLGGDVAWNADRRRLLAELEERRHVDKEAVRAEIEALVGSWVEEAESSGVTRQRMADVAEALAVWGTVRRFEGLRRDASKAYRLSLRLSSAAGCRRVVGMGLQKASYLLRDIDCNQAGLILLESATDNFLRAGEIVACAKVFVDRGIMKMALTDFDEAVPELETALRLLPEEEWRNRAASFSNLARCHEQMGRLPEATRCLLAAQKAHGDREDAGLAHILWNLGNIAMASGKPEDAEPVFVRALELLETYGKPLEFAYVALSLAEAYVRRQKIESMRRLADRMLAWLPAIRGNRVADTAMMEWIRCAKWGEVTHQALREARQKLSQAAKS